MPEHYRAAGLFAVARGCELDNEKLERLLQWHPFGARLLMPSDGSSPWGTASLRSLMIAELHNLEFRFMPGESRLDRQTPPSDVEYWQRRRELAARMARVDTVRQLPRMWQALIEMPADALRPLSLAIGLEAIAGMLRGADGDFLVQTMSRLGGELSAQVAQQLASDAAVFDSEMTRALRSCLEHFSRHHRSDKMVRRFGRSLMAVCFQSLPAEHRKIAVKMARSNFPEALDRAHRPACEAAEWPSTLEFIVRKHLRTLLSVASSEISIV